MPGKAFDRPTLVAQFPVSVVDGGDRASAHDALQFKAFIAGDLLDRVFERKLHFRERRDWHPDRQIVVEHVIFAHVGMRQHVVAEPLAVAKPRAVAEHQPGMRAKNGDMVGDRLGIGGPTPILTTVIPHGPSSSDDRRASAADVPAPRPLLARHA